MNRTTLELDPTEFAGGIAVWSAMAPVLDTTGAAPESGLHVHARERPGKAKAIDETFAQVRVKTTHAGIPEVVDLDGALANTFNIAEILVETPKAVRCPHCAKLVTDRGWAALMPHSKRSCNHCGHIFETMGDVIANPIAALREQLQNSRQRSVPEPSLKRWLHSVRDWPAGIQIWGSNDALLWTADRAEASGIHVHAYNATLLGKPRLADETFGDVEIDGEVLNAKQIRFMMAQMASPLLAPYVRSLTCSYCGEAHFETESPTTPRGLHQCAACGLHFFSTLPSISNPALAQMARLNALWNTVHG
jgi:hypothetical protein